MSNSLARQSMQKVTRTYSPHCHTAQIHAQHCACHSCNTGYRGRSRNILHTSIACHAQPDLDHTHHK